MTVESRKRAIMGGRTIFALAFLTGAHAMAQTTPDAGTVEALGKWPITVALVALCAWQIWLGYKQADSARQSHDNMANKLGELASALQQRPCIRDPKNN